MLERIQNVLRERKNDDKGFSLVELAVVIVIIGILVAIAVPIFANMQTAARKADTQAAAANGSSIVASNIATGASTDTTVAAGLSALVKDPITAVALDPTTALKIDNYCVKATSSAGTSSKGPGCAANTEWVAAP